MDKMSVVLDKHAIRISMEGKALRIDTPGEGLQRIPLGMVSQVVVYGNPEVSCNVWRKLSEYGIPSLLLPARGKGEGAWISPGPSTAVMVRIAQFNAWSDPKVCKKAAAWAVRGKFMAMQEIATRLARECPFIESSLQRLEIATSINEIRGIEGNAARQWFAFMAGLLPDEWKFSGRNRRPPKDPVNSLLSLGYTLMQGEVHKAVLARGLDPGIGFLHTPHPGRESLVLDLMEPLRPGVDAFALALVTDRLSPEDFTTGKQDGCRLSKMARGVFYGAWEDFKVNWPFSPQNSPEDEGGGNPPDLYRTAKAHINRFVRSWKTDQDADRVEV